MLFIPLYFIQHVGHVREILVSLALDTIYKISFPLILIVFYANLISTKTTGKKSSLFFF